MNKTILIIVFCLVGLNVVGQNKSIISLEKAKPVVLNLPQQKVASNLRKAGGALIGGIILIGFGSILKAQNNNVGVANITQIGGCVSLLYSGIALSNAADAYEKTLNIKKKD